MALLLIMFEIGHENLSAMTKLAVGVSAVEIVMMGRSTE